MAEGDTVPNALIGALVGVVLMGIPFSPVLGGAVSGYLQGGDREDGLRVGAITGGIMLLPMILLAFLVGNVIFFGMAGGMSGMSGMPGMGGFGFAGGIAAIFVLFALLSGLVYVVGFAAVGGYLGNYVKYDTDVDL